MAKNSKLNEIKLDSHEIIAQNEQLIIEAIQHLDKNPELLKGRQSTTYDLEFEGKKYPPILVLSEANKIFLQNKMTLNKKVYFCKNI